jgi:hypothetical protein
VKAIKVVLIVMLLGTGLASATSCGYDWLIELSYVEDGNQYIQSAPTAPTSCELVVPEDYSLLEAATNAAYSDYNNLSIAGKRSYSVKAFAAAIWNHGWKKVPMVTAAYKGQIPLTGGNYIAPGETIFTTSKNHNGMLEANNINLPNSGLTKRIEYNAYYNPSSGEIKTTCKVIAKVERFNATEYFNSSTFS